MAIDYVVLKTEIQTDPLAYGYAPHITAGNDSAIANLLNLVRTGADGFPEISVRRADIASQEIWECIVVTDYAVLPANPTAAQLSTERRYLSWLSGLAAVPRMRLLENDGTDAPAVVNLKAMFASGTGTRNRLVAAANRDGSRSEQLFGVGTSILHTDVAKALRG